MNEYLLKVSSRIEKEYYIEAKSYEEAIQKAVDYFLIDNEDEDENNITNISVEAKEPIDFEELNIEIYTE